MSGNAIGALMYGWVAVLYGLNVHALGRVGWPAPPRHAVGGRVCIRASPAPRALPDRARRVS